MGIRIKLDEDMSPYVAEPLIASGHEVYTVVEQGWSGLADDAIWSRLQAAQALLITADKGFGDIRRFPPGEHHGILLLRVQRESIVEYRALVERVVKQISLEELRGNVSVANYRGIRIRRRHMD